MYPIKIYGSGGKSICDLWQSGASAYLGMTVPLMPNFSMLYGPNRNLGHNSIILMIETQALYINALITQIKTEKEKGYNLRLEPKADLVRKYNDEIQARLKDSAFADPNCNSWYNNEAGLITNNWFDAVIPYQKRISTIQWDDFDVTGSGAQDVKRKGKTSWPRVAEETQFSNGMILTGLLTAAGAIVAGTIYRGTLKTMLRT